MIQARVQNPAKHSNNRSKNIKRSIRNGWPFFFVTVQVRVKLLTMQVMKKLLTMQVALEILTMQVAIVFFFLDATTAKLK